VCVCVCVCVHLSLIGLSLLVSVRIFEMTNQIKVGGLYVHRGRAILTVRLDVYGQVRDKMQVAKLNVSYFTFLGQMLNERQKNNQAN